MDVSHLRWGLTVAAAVLLTACSSSSVPTGSARPSAAATTAAAGSGATAAPGSAAPAAPAAGTLDRCPAARPLAALPVLARPPLRPDDLEVATEGGLWVSDPDGGHLARVDAAGTQVTRIEDPRGPEGIAVLGDGRLVLAEQKPNRLVTLRPPDPAVTELVALPPAGGRLGVDGIGLDLARRRVLIPDSAAGALRALPLDGGPLVTLATGLGRAVGAAAAPDGSVYVAAEASPGLLRIAPGGTVTPVGRLGDLDDVVVAGGLLYVTALGAHAIFAVDPAGGGDRTLVTGVGEPQGLAVLPDGRLAAADSTSGRIVAVDPC
jgi:sugar lactone lactonase YvrE